MIMEDSLDFDKQKLSLIEIILKVDDPIFLNQIEDFIVTNLPWTLPPFTHEELAERLKQSRNDYKEGRYVTIEELEEKIKKW
jgi:hypothetical protein